MVEMSESSRWENELAQFYKVLENPKGQAVVIVGPAGSGKSTLLTMMVTVAKKYVKFVCDGNIYGVGPNDNPKDIIRNIGRWSSGTVTKFQAKTILERLRESVEEYGDLHRRVVGIDAKPTMATKFEQWWMEIIPKLPEKVKFIFTQRPDDILATNEQFMNLPNVVRIDLKTVFSSDDKSEGKFEEDEEKTLEDLIQKFIKFLVEEKEYPSEYLTKRTIQTKPQSTKALCVINPNSDEIITTIGFSINDPEIRDVVSSRIHNYKQFINSKRGYKRSVDIDYIVTPRKANSHSFSIYEVIDGGNPRLIDIEDFPTYEELRNKVASELDELLFDGDLSGFKKLCETLDPISRYIVERGKKIAMSVPENLIPTLTTSCLLFAMLEHEKPTNYQCETIDFLFKKIPGPGIMEKLDLNRKAYIKSLKENYQIAPTEKAMRDEPYVTSYVVEVIKLAKEYATRTISSNIVFCRHLLAALITYKPKGREAGAVQRLRELGVSVDAILKDYPDHLKQFEEDDQEEWERILARSIEESESWGMSVAEHVWGDRIAGEDKLGFRPYVEVVARFLTHEETELPLTLSVEGEWGSGKSSFLLQLKNEIERIYKEKGKEKAFIVEFDPWRHDKDEALWAAFALKFIEDASKCLTKRKPWKANYELWKQRFNWKQAWPDILRIVLVGSAWVLATIVICIGLWDGIKLGATGTVIFPKKIGSIATLIVSLVVPLRKIFGKVKDYLGSPLAVDLKKYMHHPDYVSKVSFIEKFHEDFKKIVSAYVGEERVYVFVDDLDRCEVPKAAELMESINLMISENPKLAFVMGMDREKVAAGLAVKHEKLLPYLAERTEVYLGEEEAKRQRGVRYGYSFIEKFIQVPFGLPQPDKKSINEMLMGMSGQMKEEKKTKEEKQEEELMTVDVPQKELFEKESVSEISKNGKADLPPTPIKTDKELEEKKRDIRQEQIEEEFLKFDGDDPYFRSIVLMVSKAFDFNPRRAKQFVNIFRLRAATAKVTGLYEPKDGKRLTFEQLGKFVGIGLGWPLLIRDIECRPALLEELVVAAEGKVKAEANDKKEPETKGKRFEKWVDEEKLMELLKAGCENQEDVEKCQRFSLKGLSVNKLLQVSPSVIGIEEKMI